MIVLFDTPTETVDGWLAGPLLADYAEELAQHRL